MREQLIRRWAHAPHHCWLKEYPEWTALFAELLARIPVEALGRLLQQIRPLIVLPPVEAGRIVRVRQAMLVGASILQLDSRLLERPRQEALGILAHELAHVCVSEEAHEDPLANDLEADQLAREWGFQKELAQALQADLEPGHPRVEAAGRAA